MHKKFALAALSLALCSAPALAQQGSPNSTPGTLTRIILIHIKPGRTDQFWADFRQHLKPIYDEEKRQGILMNWSISTKPTLDNPEDWTIGIALTYPNFASLDNLTPRTDPITLAHYGSAANRTAAANARIENGTTVATFLLREQNVNPWR